MGEVQRLFYFHVAAAWLAMLAFLVVLGSSIFYLWKRKTASTAWRPLPQKSACSSPPLSWSPGHLGPSHLEHLVDLGTPPDLHSHSLDHVHRLSAPPGHLPESRRKLQFAAVYAIVAFLDVPIVFFSIRWWRTIHPIVITGRGMNLEPEMVRTMILSCVTFTFLYLVLLRLRLRVGRLEDGVRQARKSLLEME